MPEVFNVKRRKLPPGSYTYIGRGSIYGNPFTHLDLATTKATVQVSSREESVQAYEDWLRGTAWQDFEQDRRGMILRSLPKLRGKRLGCYCKPLACHGDVLVKLVQENSQ